MKKLRLELENLRVESFATAGAEAEGGTVEAHATPRNSCNPDNTCGYAETCGGWDTCVVTCADSCPCEPDDLTFYASDCASCGYSYCVSFCGSPC